MSRYFIPRLSIILLSLPACAFLAAAGARAASAGEQPLTVAAASSLQLVLREFSASYRKQTGTRAVLVFASSGNLAGQLEHGAPYDLFVSADESRVEALARKGVLDPASVRPYAQGRLALVLHPPLRFTSGGPSRKCCAGRAELELLRRAEVRHISLASPLHAPYGIAARQALQSAGLWATLRGKLVFGENVRQALTFVETGNADAGFAAEAIVRAGALRWRPVDGALHSPIRHALGIRKGSPNREQAVRFVKLLLAPAGRRLLKRHGLEPLPATAQGKRR